MTAALIRTIHVGCRQLGLDEDTRRELQLRVVGKASLSDMTAAEQQKVLDALKAEGFKPTGGAKAKRPAAARGDVRFCHVLWRLLSEAGALQKPGRAGLNAFLRSQFEGKWKSVPIDIDAMRDHDQINDVVQALKAMCRRAGVALK
ncbi:regulatory protein GemA [Pseudotabrizicola algicola]|uniref:Regulatory protein GemA n=1 Tax=Pseudotabrizicola algicola TaxID=2709381 RepID=A0A6B3RWW0_9RHOB|nr:regulatory protein GemA [Pseudotabrizicola algicola]NEX47622.1 regulatory protein GemA [Pseudotabrizicola algicola]